MKYLSLAIACGLMLSACGGTDDTPVPPPAGLEGLWHGTSVDNVNDAAPAIPVSSGEMYIALDNTADNPIDATFYTKSDSLNCLEQSTDSITHIGSNRYKDSWGAIATLSASGNNLAMTISSDGLTQRMNMQKSTAVSKADLQICGVQNDPGSLILNDQETNGFLQNIFQNHSTD